MTSGPPSGDEPRATIAVRLLEGAAALDLPLAPETADRIARLGSLLLRWNRRVNLLSSRVDEETLVESHLLDSLALLRLWRSPLRRPRGPALDVGAGAGLPGLPLRLAAGDQRLTLLEPSAKRAGLLRVAVRELALGDVLVRAQRLEELAPDERFALLLSRATFAPPEWVARAAPHLTEDGHVAVMLGRRDPAPVHDAARAAGLHVVADDAFALPWSRARRRNLLLARR